MKYLLIGILAAGLSACSHSHDDHSHGEEASGPEPLVFTLYSEKTELFVEFKPLVVGQESRFAAHFTALGSSFKAIEEGSVTLTLKGEAASQTVTADAPEVPGIFRLALTPEKPGLCQLIFEIKTPEYSDRITIKNIGVYPDEKAALAGESGGGGARSLT